MYPTHVLKILIVFELNFFILKFHCFMLLLNLITFKYSFFRSIIQVRYQYFWMCLVLGQFPSKHFLYLCCSGTASSDFIEGSGSSTLVVFENFLVLYFPFSQFLTIISSSFFLKLVISDVLLQFRCCNP